MVLKGKVVEVKRIACYDGAFKDGITYTKVVEYHFSTEEKAMEFYYTLKDDKELIKKCIDK